MPVQRTALCVGINDYPGTNADLLGCVNDAADWADALRARSFTVTTLLDAAATKAAVVQALTSHVAALGRADLFVFQYSGHGTWIPDVSGDERDRRDEALCPHDIADGQIITDDELFAIFKAAKRGSRCVMLSDSCHSGTVTKLFDPLGVSRDRVRYIAPELFLRGAALKAAQAAATEQPSPSTRAAQVALLISGCQDIEFSFDAWFGTRANGAFTRVALDALAALPEDATYNDWHKQIRAKLPSQDYPQTPNIVGRPAAKAARVLV
jgi:hypothetical protein